MSEFTKEDIRFIPRGFVPRLKPRKGSGYTECEKQFIRDNWQEMTDKEIGEALSRSSGGITNVRQNMGLTNYERHEWTEEEEQIVRDYYEDTPNDEIVEMLPRHGLHSLYRKAHALGLNKSDEFMEKQLKEKAHQLQITGKAHRFSKGHEPANKGLKQEEYMSEEAIERTKKTRFKKGHKPHNSKFDGAISIRYDHKDRGGAPYMWIRISEGEWEQYSRYQYKKHIGPIPEGHLVTFKDGDTLNCEPENLTTITRAENAHRNRDWEKSMQTMRENRNHPSIHLTDNYVAALLAGGDQDIKEYILEERPDMIKTGRAYYKSRRAIMEAEDG